MGKTKKSSLLSHHGFRLVDKGVEISNLELRLDMAGIVKLEKAFNDFYSP